MSYKTIEEALNDIANLTENCSWEQTGYLVADLMEFMQTNPDQAMEVFKAARDKLIATEHPRNLQALSVVAENLCLQYFDEGTDAEILHPAVDYGGNDHSISAGLNP